MWRLFKSPGTAGSGWPRDLGVWTSAVFPFVWESSCHGLVGSFPFSTIPHHQVQSTHSHWTLTPAPLPSLSKPLLQSFHLLNLAMSLWPPGLRAWTIRWKCSLQKQTFLPPRASVLQAGEEELAGASRIPRAWKGERRLRSEMRRSEWS